jgi:SSS family solute:Na+ symporter
MVVSLATRPRQPEELRGLVYSLTPRSTDSNLIWYKRPWVLGAVVLLLTAALNLTFF